MRFEWVGGRVLSKYDNFRSKGGAGTAIDLVRGTMIYLNDTLGVLDELLLGLLDL